MKGRNCPNCGAVLQSEVCKCPYCGTSYFDFCALNIKDGEPFYLKFLTELNGKTTEITVLVKRVPNFNINLETEYDYATNNMNKIVSHVLSRSTCTLNMTFEAIPTNINNEQMLFQAVIKDENYKFQLTRRAALLVVVIGEPKNHDRGFAPLILTFSKNYGIIYIEKGKRRIIWTIGSKS